MAFSQKVALRAEQKASGSLKTPRAGPRETWTLEGRLETQPFSRVPGWAGTLETPLKVHRAGSAIEKNLDIDVPRAGTAPARCGFRPFSRVPAAWDPGGHPGNPSGLQGPKVYFPVLTAQEGWARRLM